MCQKIDGVLQVRDQIDSFIKRAKQTINLEAVILFGSRATGDNLECSDVDLCVVSDSFEEMAGFRRTELLLGLWTGEKALEPLGFSCAEFMNTESLVVFDILAFGKPMFDRGIFLRTQEQFARKQQNGKIKQFTGGWEIRH